MSKKLNITIVGATGLVGETLLQVLAERKFPVGVLRLLASEASVGQSAKFKSKGYKIEDLATFDFTGTDIAFFAVGNQLSEKYVPKAVAAGAWVIDKSSYYRLDPDVPLVIPEVNPEMIKSAFEKIISTPNCSTIQMVMALKPIYDAVGISRVNVVTYQAVSGSGRKGVAELANQVGELMNGRPISPAVYDQQIAFNLIPYIDSFDDSGFTGEEMKLVHETRKILNDPAIQINPTAVRVPVFFGHSEALTIETKQKLSAAEAKEILAKAPGIKLVDNPTPALDALGQDDVFIGRIREDPSHPMSLNLWVVADNVRKGAASNAVQIAQMLSESVLR